MTNKFSYNGIVTLVYKIGEKAVSKSYHNKGEHSLFEAYARAISGQNVSQFTPKYIRVFTAVEIEDEGAQNVVTTYGEEATKNPIPVSVVYMDGTDATKLDTRGTDYEYVGPYARVSGIITKNMVNSGITTGSAVLELLSSKETTSDSKLATIVIENFFDDIKTMSSGAHFIILWDLYVQNDGGTNK